MLFVYHFLGAQKHFRYIALMLPLLQPYRISIIISILKMWGDRSGKEIPCIRPITGKSWLRQNLIHQRPYSFLVLYATVTQMLPPSLRNFYFISFIKSVCAGLRQSNCWDGPHGLTRYGRSFYSSWLLSPEVFVFGIVKTEFVFLPPIPAFRDEGVHCFIYSS